MLDSIYDQCEAGNYKEAMFLFHSNSKSLEYKSPQFIVYNPDFCFWVKEEKWDFI